jgi:predicted phage terminase large subunit-like protein
MIFDTSQIDPKLQLLDLDRADAEESLYIFYKHAWQYIDPAPWVDNWAIDAIAEHLQAVCDGEIRRLIINISPRCSKSNLVSVAFPAWVWAQPHIGPISGPQVPFLRASYAYQLSLRDSVKARRLIESPWYQARWGDRYILTSDQNTKSRFTNSKGGESLITSIDGTNTGEGGMCFVAGTRVSTPNGQIPIERLRVGDSVLSFDLQRGMVVKSRVLATSKRKSNDLRTLHEISGHRFTCTGNHPVFSPGRGFVRAGEMGEGDRLLVSRVQSVSNENLAALNLRQLRQEDQEKTLRAAESTKTRQPRRVLQQKMLQLSSFLQEFQECLSDLCGSIDESARSLLLWSMQNSGAPLQKKNVRVSDLQKSVCRTIQPQILLSQMRGRGALGANAWLSEFEIARARYGEVFKSISLNANSYLREGWRSLRSLQFRQPVGANFLQSENFFARTSYRRQQQEQRAGEFNHSMREMPQTSPSWENSHVAEISRDSSATVDVYDIQVEGQSNFFAESILVHNCILIDDPNSVDDIDSEAAIQTTIDWWTGTMPTRLNNQDTGAYIIIQQRTFEDDLTGHILETEADDWVHLMIPMRYEPERSYPTIIGWKDPRTTRGELMWPERFSEAATTRLEKRLGPFRAAGQLQQRPEPAGGGIIKSEWWILWEKENYPPMDFILGTLDTAYTEDTMNDPSGMMIWGIFSDVKELKEQSTANFARPRDYETPQKRVILDHTYDGTPRVLLLYAWDDHLELNPLVNRVQRTCKDFKVDLLLIENKASGISVAQEIRRIYNNEKYGVQLCDPKSQDKIARLYSVQHLFADGLIYSPDKEWSQRVIKQVGQFPKGRHDEFVDLTSMGLRYLRDNGLIQRGPERLADLEAQKAYPRGNDQPLYGGI